MNKKLKSKKANANKGITLIALIITIIVLLILAVVAIRAVAGGGILAHARNARDKWIEEAANEEAMLGNLTNYITEQSGNNPDGGGSGETYVKVTKDTPATDNGTINGAEPSADNPIIPKGFIPIDTETSHWGDGNSAPDAQSVKNGLIITDHIDAEGKSDGNEFVWIPVPTLSDFAVYKTDENNKDANNYRGVLYNFQSDKSKNTTKDWSDTDYREPDVVVGDDSQSYDAVEANLNKVLDDNHKATKTAASFKAQLQEEFNSMVESVAKYKGFYVGRYEMSESNGKVQSKKGAESLQNTTDANNWYGLYSKAKTYAATDSSVTSEMIWGCQWDAMMRWMQENNINVTSSAPTDTGRSNATTSPNTGSTTGSVAEDRLNNVYDLLGNRYEWIQEAGSLSDRVYRGGSSFNNVSPSNNSGNNRPTHTSEIGYSGSRLSLYVKLA